MSIHRPATRAEFKDFILRGLGSPVININVTDDQIEDCIEYALSYYIDYHYNGTDLTYLKYQMTQTDIDNGYINISENIIGVKRVFPFSSWAGGSDMFSPIFQITMSMLPDLGNVDLMPYYMARLQLAQIQELLVGQFPIRYNKMGDKLYLDVSATKLDVGQYIIVECYTALDADTNTDVWNERVVQKHVSALVKRIWGNNLNKFEGIQLPGGVTLSGRSIIDDALEELSVIEDTYRDNYSLPAEDIIM